LNVVEVIVAQMRFGGKFRTEGPTSGIPFGNEVGDLPIGRGVIKDVGMVGFFSKHPILDLAG
jgi:hypothetical protein